MTEVNPARQPVEEIFSNVCRAVKMLKLVLVHSFRHSLVTHLLEENKKKHRVIVHR